MMNGRAGQIAMRVLAWLMVALLVTGLVPALPEVPYALAESKEKMVELGGESQSSEDGSEGPGLPIVGDVRDGGAHADGNAEVAPADGAESVVVEGAGQGDCFGNDAQGLKVQEDTDTDMAEVEDAVRDDKLTLAAQSVSVSDPRVAKDSDMESGQVTTWDCVWSALTRRRRSCRVARRTRAYSLRAGTQMETPSWVAGGIVVSPSPTRPTATDGQMTATTPQPTATFATSRLSGACSR